MKKLLLIGLCLCLAAPMSMDADAQGRGKKKGHYKGHYIKVKRTPPAFTQLPTPGSGHVYVREDWRWNSDINDWEWYGNRWVAAPQPVKVWVPGHWRRTRYGYTWVDGYWR